MYDTISATEFIDFFSLKVIDNFNISKINVKLEDEFTVPFKKRLHKLPLFTLSLLLLTTYTDNRVGKTFSMPLCVSVYICLVVTCWERADLCGV